MGQQEFRVHWEVQGLMSFFCCVTVTFFYFSPLTTSFKISEVSLREVAHSPSTCFLHLAFPTPSTHKFPCLEQARRDGMIMTEH